MVNNNNMRQLSIFTLLLAAIALTAGCTKEETTGPKKKMLTLTFEDSTFSGGDNENDSVIANSWWAQYIDSPQYGGNLLYGGKGYAWYDNTTTLSSSLPDYWGDGTFFGGGIAISNYVENPIGVTYEKQLTIGSTPVSGKNFAVCYVATNEAPPFIEFKYGEGVVDNLYVMPTAYTNEIVQNGNAFAPAMSQNGYIRIEATGIDKSGVAVGTIAMYLYDGRMYSSWKKWSLAELGVVKRIEFRMYEGVVENGQRIDSTAQYPTYPFYFAIDNITVQK